MVVFPIIYKKKYQQEKVPLWYFFPRKIPYSTQHFFSLVLFSYTPTVSPNESMNELKRCLQNSPGYTRYVRKLDALALLLTDLPAEISSNLYRTSVCDMRKKKLFLIGLSNIEFYPLQSTWYGMAENILGKLPDHL